MDTAITRALIVEDAAEARQWLADVTRAAFPDCEVDAAATAAAGRAAVESARYGLAIVDIGLPDGSGLDVLRALKTAQPEAIGVIATVVGDDAHIVAALAAGAQGYLLKHELGDTVARQLRQLAQGLPVLSPSIARRIMEHFRLTGPAAAAEHELTPREAEVLKLIGGGFRNADVARDLGVGESTVASHIKSIYRKLGISSRAEAAWHASRLGLRTGLQD